MIVASPYGIFLSRDNGGESITDVIHQMTNDFYDKIESIKNSITYDDFEVVPNDGVYAIRWDEVLSVYSVLITTKDSPTEVVTVDQNKKALLQTLLEEMNSIGFSTAIETHEEIETVLDEDGNEIEETVEKAKTTLTIRLNHRTATEEAFLYGFDDNQLAVLNDMLSGKYSTLWASVIGGYSQGLGIIPTKATWVGIGRFCWPLPINGTITSGFGYRSDPFTGENVFHGGLDIAAAEGTPIVAADDGIVTVANGVDSWGGGYGFYVIIDHGGSYETLYGHCSSICVLYGQIVRKGEVIAYVGSTGNSTGNHLHFEIRANGQKDDPAKWFV
jgi:murein DD-endopeptidase MepM/ murein hydrolase activator NlpD